MAIELPSSEEERALRVLIEQASATLAKRRRDIPTTFVAQLYGRSAPDDVLLYGADDIAALAEGAYDFMVDREPGVPKIRCATVLSPPPAIVKRLWSSRSSTTICRSLSTR